MEILVKTLRRRRGLFILAAAILGVAAVSVGVSRLKPAAPTVERGTVWTDTVKRGTMLRQVQGLGRQCAPKKRNVRFRRRARRPSFAFVCCRARRSKPTRS